MNDRSRLSNLHGADRDDLLDIDKVDDTGEAPTEEYYEDEQPTIKPKDIIDYSQESLEKSKAKHITVPFLTKYERARLLSTRIEQLNKGSIPMVDVKNLTNTKDIAKKELEERKIPLIVRRKLPNGETEDWKIEEFISINPF